VAVAMAELVYCLRFDVILVLEHPKAVCYAGVSGRHVVDANVWAIMVSELESLSVNRTVSFARRLDVVLKRCGKPGGREAEEGKSSRQLHIWPMGLDVQCVSRGIRMIVDGAVLRSA
jgi:hypothetical protein